MLYQRSTLLSLESNRLVRCVFVQLVLCDCVRDDYATHPVSPNKSHKHREEDGGWRCFRVLPEELHCLVKGILSKTDSGLN